MTNLQKFAAQQLSKKEMNKITGGDSPCPQGEQAYNCVLTIGYVGHGTAGIVCGTSRKDAEAKANALLAKVMEVTDEDRYVC